MLIAIQLGNTSSLLYISLMYITRHSMAYGMALDDDVTGVSLSTGSCCVAVCVLAACLLPVCSWLLYWYWYDTICSKFLNRLGRARNSTGIMLRSCRVAPCAAPGATPPSPGSSELSSSSLMLDTFPAEVYGARNSAAFPTYRYAISVFFFEFYYRIGLKLFFSFA